MSYDKHVSVLIEAIIQSFSLDCIEKLVESMESMDIEERDCDTSWKIEKQILTDDIG